MTYYRYNRYQDPRPKIVSDGGRDVAYLHVTENNRFVTDISTVDNRSSEYNGRLAYKIVGGVDAHLFQVDRRTGKVYFKHAPDYESPLDYGRNNRYQVKVKVVDAAGYSDTQLLDITVKNVQEVDPRPEIISDGGGNFAHVSVDENTTFVTDVETTDNISTEANGRLSYFIHGGADKDFFSIDKKTGEISFNYAPDFESPQDSGYDNTYEVGVKVVDGAGYTDTQTIKVVVNDVKEDDGGHNPGPGDNIIEGDSEDNFLEGTGADESFFGAGGNDVLIGGGGNDRLNGTNGISRGVGEVDNLSGSEGADAFLLGDTDGAFYVGNGFGDFAIINDFSAGEDSIVLAGSAGDYTLVDGTEGEAFILTNNGNDAIARISGQSSANLDLSTFDFV
ncbi:MAG: cadherin domain-containing protein [Cyanobacteria bacterium J06649_5]